MIGRVLPRGENIRGVLQYLFGNGRHNEHTNPRIVAGWRDPADLEPPRRADGKRNFTPLATKLELPVRYAKKKVADKYVYHLIVRAEPGDPHLGYGAWKEIATEIMHRLGLSVRGREDKGVCWVAVHHGDNHIHIVATLAGQDKLPVWPRNDYWRLGESLRDIEVAYGLSVRVRADRTAPKALTRAEMERAKRTGRTPDRVVLYRHVRTAAAAARDEDGFFAALATRGVLSWRRYSPGRPEEAVGYCVALADPPRRPQRAPDGQPGDGRVWFAGGTLAPDLTLPKLGRKWSGPRLSGQGMTRKVAEVAITREALRAARAAWSEIEFFTLLARAGLTARLRLAQGEAGHFTGWVVTLPGLTDSSGQPAWLEGDTLSPALELGRLRARWQAGQPGAVPGPDYFTGAARTEVYEHAARVAALAAADLEAGRPADTAWAAADLLTAVAAVTGNAELDEAAEEFTRAARAAWGRVPAPTPNGQMLRTAAYLIASCRRTSHHALARAVRVLLTALASLARTLAKLRTAQARPQQATAAVTAAAQLVSLAATIDYGETVPGVAAIAFPGSHPAGRPAAAAERASRTGPRSQAPGRGAARRSL